MPPETEEKTVSLDEARAGVPLEAGHPVILTVDGARGSFQTRKVDWEFRRAGAPLGDQPYVIHCDDGTELRGKLAGGRLQRRVPPGRVSIDLDAAGDEAGLVELNWEFADPEGKPLGGHPYVVHCGDGTTREGRLLEGGLLRVKVPHGHVTVEIDGHLVTPAEGVSTDEPQAGSTPAADSAGDPPATDDAAAPPGDDPAAGTPAEDGGGEVELSWEFADPDGKPLTGHAYAVHCQDGTLHEGTLAEGGLLQIKVPHGAVSVEIDGHTIATQGAA